MKDVASLSALENDMGFSKKIKNNPYFKRYQVKFRRRREGKTDYRARKRLVSQDKNKYDSPKYRLVVRLTNKDIITQIVHAKITGDFVLKSAYAHELPRFGFKVGLTNYAAAYSTGLLLARRLLKHLGLDAKYKGVEKPSGKFFNYTKQNIKAKQLLARKKGTSLAKARAPFKALLDVGLRRTTTGAKIFAALKGAVDGGISVPHSEARFAGYKNGKLNAEVLRSYIFGGHVATYMRTLKSKGAEAYQRQFARYIKAGIEADAIEGIIAKTHAAIRADPTFKSTKKTKPEGYKQKRFNRKRLNAAARKNTVQQKINFHLGKLQKAAAAPAAGK